MKLKELIEKFEERKTIIGNYQGYAVWWEDVKEIFEQLDEPETGHADEAPRYLKNILARLRELPLHNREVWLKVIMSEFKQDFSHAKWREGYEQGKLEGMVEQEKAKVPQFVADWIKHSRNTGCSLFGAMSIFEENIEIKKWMQWSENQELFARAWLDGYEVEEEKKYFVKLKAVDQYLVSVKDEDFLGFLQSRLRSKFTRKELEDANLGWVFDCPGIEMEEVE